MTITFNGVTLTYANGFTVNRTEGFSSPSIRVSEANITNRDGGNVYSRKWGMRTLVIEGDIIGTDADDYFTKRLALTNAFNLDSATMTVTNWDNDTFTIDCKVVQAPVIIETPGITSASPYRISLRASNPFFLGVDDGYSCSLGTGGGTPISAPISAPIGPQSGNRMTITNDGGANSYAKFTITPDTTAIVGATVTNLASGEYFTIDTTIPLGSYVEIYRDSAGLHVLKDGSTDWFTYFVGDFFEIEQGNNTIVFTATSGDGDLEAIFNDPYLTI